MFIIIFFSGEGGSGFSLVCDGWVGLSELCFFLNVFVCLFVCLSCFFMNTCTWYFVTTALSFSFRRFYVCVFSPVFPGAHAATNMYFATVTSGDKSDSPVHRDIHPPMDMCQALFSFRVF